MRTLVLSQEWASRYFDDIKNSNKERELKGIEIKQQVLTCLKLLTNIHLWLRKRIYSHLNYSSFALFKQCFIIFTLLPQAFIKSRANNDQNVHWNVFLYGKKKKKEKHLSQMTVFEFLCKMHSELILSYTGLFLHWDDRLLNLPKLSSGLSFHICSASAIVADVIATWGSIRRLPWFMGELWEQEMLTAGP